MQSTPGQPTGTSLLCLSCHDGTVALENYGGATGGSAYVTTGLVGTDLSNDHPISITYDDVMAGNDGGLNLPSSTASTVTATGSIQDDLLFSDQIQCASCHDVHGTAFPSLLRVDNAGSALCLLCHNK